MKIYPYDPLNYKYDELKATFTGREELFEEMVSNIKAQSDYKNLQHYLITGPRGIGKTHLLRMLYFRIKEESPQQWLPLQFAEEEYTVVNLRGFFERLVEEIRDELGSLPDWMNGIEARIKDEKDDRKLVDEIIASLERFTTNNKRKILLLVDNIDQILSSGFMDSLSLKRLRTFLMDEGILLLIGSAATVFKEVIDYKAPLYHLFQRINLVELPVEQGLIFIKNWATAIEHQEILTSFAAYEQRIKSIYHLTGGNPRLLLFLFQILTAGKLPAVEDAFDKLISEMTPYFKAKMEALSPQKRQIMAGFSKIDITDMEEGISPSYIAKLLRFPLNKTTAVIKVLVDDGYLKPVQKGKKRGTFYYDVVEQLFRIWYQMRSSTTQRKRFEWLLRFISLWYSLPELDLEIENMEEECKNVDSFQKRNLIEVHLSYLKEVKKRKIKEIVDKGERLLKIAWDKDALEYYNQAVFQYPDIPSLWAGRGKAFLRFGDYAQALNCFNKAIEKDPQDIQSLINKVSVLNLLGRYEETLTCLEKITDLALLEKEGLEIKSSLALLLRFYVDATLDLALKENLKRMKEYINKLIKIRIILDKNKIKEEEVGFERLLVQLLIEILKENRPQSVLYFIDTLEVSEIKDKVAFLFPLRIIAGYLETPNEDIINRQTKEVREIITEIIKQILPFKEEKEKKELPQEPISPDELQRLGIAYAKELDYERAIEAFKMAIRIYEDNQMQNHPDYALCQMNLGIAYDGKLDYDRAIEAFQEAIKIYSANQMQNHPFYALCQMSLGNAYAGKLNYDWAIEAYQKAIRIYGDNQMQNHPDYAKCQVNLGTAYWEKLDYERAIEAYQEAIKIYSANQMQNHPEYAGCQMNLGLAYDAKLDYERAIEAFKMAIRIYEDNQMQNHPDYALCQMNLGEAYQNKLDYERAIEAYQKAIRIYEQNRMQNHPDYALCQMNLGEAYRNKLDYERAIEAYQKAIRIYEDNQMQNHPDYALCQMNLGIAYRDTGKKEEAIKLFNLALSIFEKTLPREHPWYQKCLNLLKA
ncbi:MAG: DUF2225 domain-containing protein [bacterium]